MTEGQRDIDEARSELEAKIALQRLTKRLRQDMPAMAHYVICGYCAGMVKLPAYACKTCGWKVAV